jgi:AcrR family transcriptional regulator
MSGKPGRPPEDRLRRQHEIFLAVAPLIERYGAKRLTMRQAARAAHLSLGGLYHYFPTKRDLVLHALKPEAVARVCADFHERHAGLERSDPWRYVEADVAYLARQCFFIRPAFQAALELDAEVAWDHIQASIEGGLESCTRPLGHALPECPPEEIRRLGRSVRRTFFSALIDRTVTPAEMRHELLSLIQGWPATVRQKTPPERLKGIVLTNHAGQPDKAMKVREAGRAKA